MFLIPEIINKKSYQAEPAGNLPGNKFLGGMEKNLLAAGVGTAGIALFGESLRLTPDMVAGTIAIWLTVFGARAMLNFLTAKLTVRNSQFPPRS